MTNCYGMLCLRLHWNFGASGSLLPVCIRRELARAWKAFHVPKCHSWHCQRQDASEWEKVEGFTPVDPWTVPPNRLT